MTKWKKNKVEVTNNKIRNRDSKIEKKRETLKKEYTWVFRILNCAEAQDARSTSCAILVSITEEKIVYERKK